MPEDVALDFTHIPAIEEVLNVSTKVVSTEDNDKIIRPGAQRDTGEYVYLLRAKYEDNLGGGFFVGLDKNRASHVIWQEKNNAEFDQRVKTGEVCIAAIPIYFLIFVK